MAPEALIYAYRVFGCEGSSDVVIDAINQAVERRRRRHQHVIGVALRRPRRPHLRSVHNASAAGIIVVASAGNEGPSGSWSDRRAQPPAISVAALDTIPAFRVATIGVGPATEAINANEHPPACR